MFKITRRGCQKKSHFRPRQGTIGSWTLPSGREVTATMTHDWAPQVDPTKCRAHREAIVLDMTLTDLEERDQMAVLFGQAGMEMRQRIFLIECRLGKRQGPYDPRDVVLTDYMQMTADAKAQILPRVMKDCPAILLPFLEMELA